MFNRTALRSIWKTQAPPAVPVAAETPRAIHPRKKFVSVADGARAPRSGLFAGSPKYRFIGETRYDCGKRVPHYERVGPIKPEWVAFQRLRDTWFEVNGFTAKAGFVELGKLRRKHGETDVLEGSTRVLTAALTDAGIDPDKIAAGEPLDKARTPSSSGKEIIRLTAPGAQWLGAKKTAEQLAVEKFNESVALREAGKWGELCIFYKANETQIKAGRAAVLRELDAAISKASPSDLAELTEYKKELQNL